MDLSWKEENGVQSKTARTTRDRLMHVRLRILANVVKLTARLAVSCKFPVFVPAHRPASFKHHFGHTHICVLVLATPLLRTFFNDSAVEWS